jgi:hypothetical protein
MSRVFVEDLTNIAKHLVLAIGFYVKPYFPVKEMCLA